MEKGTCYILETEYSGGKRNGVLIHAPVWMKLENITLSKRRQTQEATCCVTPFIGSVQSSQTTETENISGCLGPGAGGRGSDC